MRRIPLCLFAGHVSEWRGSNRHSDLLFVRRNDRWRKCPLLEEAALIVDNLRADDRWDGLNARDIDRMASAFEYHGDTA
jgi:hypothetical protein